jgi:hypothetical protein
MMELKTGERPGVLSVSLWMLTGMLMIVLVISDVVWPDLTAADESKSSRIWNFDQDPRGVLPQGFFVGTTLDGRAAGEWKVIDMEKAMDWLHGLDRREYQRIKEVLHTLSPPSPPHVMAQLKNRGFEQDYHVVLVEDTTVTDFDLRVSFLPVAGKGDMGGGLIWRARDDQNYYITRANPLEQNIRLYRVVEGVRYHLANFDHIISVDAWHTLQVKARGDHFKVIFDGQTVLDDWDGTFQSGMIGLWTKADAVTYFDDLHLFVIK